MDDDRLRHPRSAPTTFALVGAALLAIAIAPAFVASPAHGGDGDAAALSGEELGLARLGEALEALPAPEPGPRDGLLIVRVVTHDGAPLPGVRVTAQPAAGPPYIPGLRTGASPLEREVLETVARHRWMAALRTGGETDADGYLIVDDLAEEVAYAVRAERDGYAIAPAPGYALGGLRSGDEVALVATGIVEVPVRVLRPDGREADEAQVVVERADRTSMARWTPEQPALTLRAGRATLTARADDLRSEPVTAYLEAGRPAREVTLQLVGRTGIRVRVELPPGLEGAYSQLIYLRLPPGAQPDEALLERMGSRTHSRTEVDGGARFDLMDVAPGDYLLGASWGGEEIVATALVAVSEGVRAETTLRLPAPDPDRALIVRAFDHAGAPLEDLGIDIYHETGRRSRGGSTTVLRRPDGASQVVLTAEAAEVLAGDREGTLTLYVSAQGHGERTVTLAAGDPREVEVRFGAPATLTVTVDGYLGSGLEGDVQVHLAAIDDETAATHGAAGVPVMATAGRGATSTHFATVLELEETVTLGPVEAGHYQVELVVSSSGDMRMQAAIATETVRLDPGETRLALRIPELHSVAVVIEGGTPDQHVSLLPREGAQRGLGGFGGSWYQSPDADGRLVFERVPAGPYRVQTYGPEGLAFMDIDVPARGEVRFEAQPVNALAVTITDRDGVLAGAGLEDGDLIIAVNGIELESMMQMQMGFMQAVAQPESTVTVLRGGRTFETTLPFQDMRHRGSDALGGDLEPASR